MGNNLFKIKKDLGILIAFEGISGCGKSESIKMLREHFRNSGCGTYLYEWNSNKLIRNMVGRLNAVKLMNSYVYSFLQWIGFLIDYIRVILPLLKKDFIIISDRYVYTGIIRDGANGSINKVGSLIYKLVRKPDITIFFDTEPQICYERIKARKKELFHTNRLIHGNKLIKNKDLYYLKKQRYEYVRCFGKSETINQTNLLHVINNKEDIEEYMNSYIKTKMNINGVKGTKAIMDSRYKAYLE